MPEENELEPNFISCPSCGHNVSPRASNCPKCGVETKKSCVICQESILAISTYCPKCGDPTPFETIQPDSNDNLIGECLFCNNKISKRSKKCPYCANSAIIPCPLCKSSISIWDASCAECGEPEPFSDEFQKKLNIGQGLRITRIRNDSQSELLGIKKNDIIFTYNGTEIKDNEDLNNARNKAKYENIDDVKILIIRDTKKITITATPDPLGITCLSDEDQKHEKVQLKPMQHGETTEPLKRRRKLLATTICIGIYFSFHIFIATPLGWRNGGGAIPQALLIGTILAVWFSIAKKT